MDPTFGILYMILIAFGIVLIIAWIILPFAIIGTKPLLEKLISESRRTNDLLSAVESHMRRNSTQP